MAAALAATELRTKPVVLKCVVELPQAGRVAGDSKFLAPSEIHALQPPADDSPRTESVAMDQLGQVSVSENRVRRRRATIEGIDTVVCKS
jgi:hypothetical protein